MANSITEGRELVQVKEGNGELGRRPATAVEELAQQVAAAHAAKTAGQIVESREVSSIASRGELRQAALNETAPPGTPNRTVAVDRTTVRQWADLDAAEFARLRSPANRDTAMDTIATNVRSSSEYAVALTDRSPALSAAAATINVEIVKADAERQRQATDIASRESNQARASAQLALMDASALNNVARIRSVQSELASDALRTSTTVPAATDRGARADATLEASSSASASRSAQPDIAPEALRAIKRPLLEDEIPAELRRRFIIATEKAGLMDQGATAFHYRGGSRDGQVAFTDAGKQLTSQQSDQEVVRGMVALAQAKGWKEITVSGSEAFQRAAWLDASLQGLRVNGYDVREADKQRLAELQQENKRGPTNAITSNDRERAQERGVGRAAAQERPAEATEALRGRLLNTVGQNAVMTIEEEFKLRTARERGDVDGSKSLQQQATERHDRDLQTIRSMDDGELRSLARLYDGPASAEGERKMRTVLADAAKRHDISGSKELKEPQQREPERHYDGDRLSRKEQDTLDTLRGLLKSKNYGPEFVAATMVELESRMRSQRVHVGAVMEHGPARYQFQDKNDPSYFVRLRTANGEDVVWGKTIGEALEKGGVKVGDQIALTNSGKKPVTVTERTTDESGRTVAHDKAATLNAWTAQPIDRLTSLDRAAATDKAQHRNPTVQLYDMAATRSAPAPAQVQSRTPERQISRDDRADR